MIVRFFYLKSSSIHIQYLLPFPIGTNNWNWLKQYQMIKGIDRLNTAIYCSLNIGLCGKLRLVETILSPGKIHVWLIFFNLWLVTLSVFEILAKSRQS